MRTDGHSTARPRFGFTEMFSLGKCVSPPPSPQDAHGAATPRGGHWSAQLGVATPSAREAQLLELEAEEETERLVLEIQERDGEFSLQKAGVAAEVLGLSLRSVLERKRQQLSNGERGGAPEGAAPLSPSPSPRRSAWARTQC